MRTYWFAAVFAAVIALTLCGCDRGSKSTERPREGYKDCKARCWDKNATLYPRGSTAPSGDRWRLKGRTSRGEQIFFDLLGYEKCVDENCL